MTIPVTRHDFVLIGQLYASEDIVKEADRLLPLATEDIQTLAKRGYTMTELEALRGYRDRLSAESADRREQRGAKKAARAREGVAVRDGKRVLRSGVVLAVAAIARRPVPSGESEETTREIVAGLMLQVDALTGRIGTDSAKLRTRLGTLKNILALPELQPSAPEAGGRTEFLAKVDDALKKLPGLAESKKAHQEEAKARTEDLDEIDGRAYFNMKLLCQVGRAYFNEHGDPGRAGGYQLNALHVATAKRTPPPA
ncbi:MAG: hypothetical protein HY906_23510 [Deltaproteobacteria bacterium]|nr:hypothetical protein [Deltaproteobacteria bacterium]